MPDANYRWAHNLLVTPYAVAGGFVISAVLDVALAVVVIWTRRSSAHARGAPT